MKDEPAFPCQREGVNNEASIVYYSGMTLRDYFASKAMNGLISMGGNQGTPQECAKYAYEYADAMLEERTKDEPKQIPLTGFYQPSKNL